MTDMLFNLMVLLSCGAGIALILISVNIGMLHYRVTRLEKNNDFTK